MTLKNKGALVTGSTSGIGLAIARALAAEGFHIALNGFGDEAEIESIRQKIEKDYGVKAIFSPADISQYEAVAAMVEDVEARLGVWMFWSIMQGFNLRLRLKIFPSKNGNRLLISISQGFFTAFALHFLP
jgi:3-hydroxybutyrate dehydrogenase